MPAETGMLLAAGVCFFGLCSGDPVGESCRITGSSFFASHDCTHKCLQHRQIICPSGDRIRPKVCSGKADCDPGNCPDGQVCYTIDDPYNRESYCVHNDICGAPLNDADARQWERESRDRAVETRRRRAEKFKGYHNNPESKTAVPAGP